MFNVGLLSSKMYMLNNGKGMYVSAYKDAYYISIPEMNVVLYSPLKDGFDGVKATIKAKLGLGLATIISPTV